MSAGWANHTLVFWLGATLALLLPAYAEIHFRLPGLPSRLFRREPEILFDLPFRAQAGKPIPLCLLVKDAHQFPVQVLRAWVTVVHLESRCRHRLEFPLHRRIDTALWYNVLELNPDVFPHEGDYTLQVTLDYQIGRHRRRLSQDNYRGRRKPPFQLYVSREPLPAESGWLWGDLHTHSSYTRDQLEFGAPPELLARTASALGLDFAAITDHSYDLDTPPPEPYPDPAQPAPWAAFQQEVDAWNEKRAPVVLLRGEEISVGNAEGRNVHALMLGNRRFYPGRGDGGRRFWQTRPTMDLPHVHRLRRQEEPDALLFAAHPLSRPPASQQWILNRGHWSNRDLLHSHLHGWQILNGPVDAAFWEGLRLWKKVLLKGQKTVLIGGSDAHGNFNLFRQISVPLLKLERKPVHRLGEARTALFVPGPREEAAFLGALRQGKAVVSTGPFLNLSLSSEKRTWHIGETAPAATRPVVHLSARSSREFGGIRQLWLRIGLPEQGYELSLPLPVKHAPFQWQEKRAVALPGGKGYIRGELVTERKGQLYYCFTNPIWIGL